MTGRPKRTIFKKKLEFNEGLHWQEERDLLRALYASLQGSGEREELTESNGATSGVDIPSYACEEVEEDSNTESSTFMEDSGVMSEQSSSVETEVGSIRKSDTRVLRKRVKKDRQKNKVKKKRRIHEKIHRELRHKVFKPVQQNPLDLEIEELNAKKRNITVQRKFAVSYSPSPSPAKPSPSSTPTSKMKAEKSSNNHEGLPSFLSFSPRTEDFLTFLCLRGSPALPRHLDLIQKSNEKSERLARQALEEDAKDQALPNRIKTKARILIQKAKANAIHNMNKSTAGRPSRECKVIHEPVRETSSNILVVGTDTASNPLAPPCLSPVPPLMESPSAHHHPPPLIPIMPLKSAKHSKNLRLRKRLEISGKFCGENQIISEGSSAAKERKRMHYRRKLRSRDSESSEDISFEEHSRKGRKERLKQRALRKKSRMLSLRGRNNRHNLESMEGSTEAEEVTKEMLKLKNVLKTKHFSSKHTKSESGKTKTKSHKINGVRNNSRVTRASAQKTTDKVIFNGHKKQKQVSSDASESIVRKLRSFHISKEEVKEETRKQPDGNNMELTPRRSKRKRTPRFDMDCVLAEENNHKIDFDNSLLVTCPCCPSTENENPKRRRRRRDGEESNISHKTDHSHRRYVSTTDNSSPLSSTHSGLAKSECNSNLPDHVQVPLDEGSVKELLEKKRVLKRRTSPRNGILNLDVVDIKEMREDFVKGEDHLIKPEKNSTICSKSEERDSSSTSPENDSQLSKVQAKKTSKKLLREKPLTSSKDAICEALKDLSPNPRELIQRVPKDSPKDTKEVFNGLCKKPESKQRSKRVITPTLKSLESFEEFESIVPPQNGDSHSFPSPSKKDPEFVPHVKSKPSSSYVNSTRKRSGSEPLRKKLEKRLSCRQRPTSSFSKGRGKGTSPLTLQSSTSSKENEALSTNNSPSLTPLSDVPTFHVTPLEWENLAAFLEGQSCTIKSAGMCKIIPPDGVQISSSASDNLDKLRFIPEVQYIHRLKHRWSSASKKLACLKRYVEKRENVAFQSPQISGCELDLLKFAELIKHEGGVQSVQMKKKWPKVADQLNIPRHVQGRTTKLESICSKYLVAFLRLSSNVEDDILKEVEAERNQRLNGQADVNPLKVNESEVKRLGHVTNLEQFKQRAAVSNEMIRAGEDNTPSEVEKDFWKIVNDADRYSAVQRAEVSLAMADRNLNCVSRLLDDKENILNLLPSSIQEKMSKVKFGSVYSTEPWRISNQGMVRMEYLLSGNPKIWYSIPESHTKALECVLQKHAAELKTKRQSCLYDQSFIYMLPPSMLQDRDGVGKVFKATQNPGEIMVQWYGAATSSISCGFHISQCFPYATSHWLQYGINAFQISKTLHQPIPFSFEHLLHLLIQHILQGRSASQELVKRILPVFQDIKKQEIRLRKRLKSSGARLMALADRISLSSSCRMSPGRGSPARGSRSPGRSGSKSEDQFPLCNLCSQYCYFSVVMNEREDKVFCLQHASEHLNGKTCMGWTIYYRLSEEKMEEIVDILSQPFAPPSDSGPPPSSSTESSSVIKSEISGQNRQVPCSSSHRVPSPDSSKLLSQDIQGLPSQSSGVSVVESKEKLNEGVKLSSSEMDFIASNVDKSSNATEVSGNNSEENSRNPSTAYTIPVCSRESFVDRTKRSSRKDKQHSNAPKHRNRNFLTQEGAVGGAASKTGSPRGRKKMINHLNGKRLCSEILEVLEGTPGEKMKGKESLDLKAMNLPRRTVSNGGIYQHKGDCPKKSFSTPDAEICTGEDVLDEEVDLGGAVKQKGGNWRKGPVIMPCTGKEEVLGKPDIPDRQKNATTKELDPSDVPTGSSKVEVDVKRGKPACTDRICDIVNNSPYFKRTAKQRGLTSVERFSKTSAILKGCPSRLGSPKLSVWDKSLKSDGAFEGGDKHEGDNSLKGDSTKGSKRTMKREETGTKERTKIKRGNHKIVKERKTGIDNLKRRMEGLKTDNARVGSGNPKNTGVRRKIQTVNVEITEDVNSATVKVANCKIQKNDSGSSSDVSVDIKFASTYRSVGVKLQATSPKVLEIFSELNPNRTEVSITNAESKTEDSSGKLQVLKHANTALNKVPSGTQLPVMRAAPVCSRSTMSSLRTQPPSVLNQLSNSKVQISSAKIPASAMVAKAKEMFIQGAMHSSASTSPSVVSSAT